ncbi:MAG: MazG nucleotide pyrophosphohydrolase domain-containing protein [Nanobdellota archaeon]
MELQKAQEEVNKYFELSGHKVWPRFAIIARLQEEISEIARIISVDEGLRQQSKIDNMNYTDEFGDALFQLIHLANQCDVDIEKSMEYVIEKYKQYIPKDDERKNAK